MCLPDSSVQGPLISHSHSSPIPAVIGATAWASGFALILPIGHVYVYILLYIDTVYIMWCVLYNSVIYIYLFYFFVLIFIVFRLFWE